MTCTINEKGLGPDAMNSQVAATCPPRSVASSFPLVVLLWFPGLAYNYVHPMHPLISTTFNNLLLFQYRLDWLSVILPWTGLLSYFNHLLSV